MLFFASMGLPGLCGFVGELFVMMAAWSFAGGSPSPQSQRHPHRGVSVVDVAAGIPRHQSGHAGFPGRRPPRGRVFVAIRGPGVPARHLAADLDLQLGRPAVSGWVGESRGIAVNGDKDTDFLYIYLSPPMR